MPPRRKAKIKDNIRVTYYLNKRLDGYVRKLAEKTGRSLSDIVGSAIEHYVKSI